MPVGRNRASDVCKRLWMGFGRLLWVLFSPPGWVSSNLGDLLVNSFGPLHVAGSFYSGFGRQVGRSCLFRTYIYGLRYPSRTFQTNNANLLPARSCPNKMWIMTTVSSRARARSEDARDEIRCGHRYRSW